MPDWRAAIDWAGMEDLENIEKGRLCLREQNKSKSKVVVPIATTMITTGTTIVERHVSSRH